MSTHGLRHLSIERLEQRRCLASSMGWDGPGLGSSDLLYSIGTVPDHLDRQQVESTIEAALDVWSDVADVTFRPTSRQGQADAIDIRFTSIDGPGGTLARAYFPDDLNRNPIAGDVEFDAGDRWEVGNDLGSAAYDLLLVAVHEIGHALGLGHSPVDSSVMHRAVSSQSQFTGLSQHDIDHMLQLYAAAPIPEAAAPPVPTPAPNIVHGELPEPTLNHQPGDRSQQPPSQPPTPTRPAEPTPQPEVPPSTNRTSSEVPNRGTPSSGQETTRWDILRQRLHVLRSALLRLSFSSFASDVDRLFTNQEWDVG